MKKLLTILASVLMCTLTIFSLTGCGTSGRDGRDGKDGTSVTISQIYQEVKSIDGNEDMTFEEFLREYLSYDDSAILSASSTEYTVGRSLMTGVSIISRFAYTKTSSITAIGGSSSVTSHKAYKGSGVIIEIDKEKGDALVVTNAHMVYKSDADDVITSEIGLYLYGQDLENVNYKFDSDYNTYNDDNYRIEATVIGASVDYDIALLKVSGSEVLKRSDAIAATFCTDDDVYIGEQVFTVGNASGEGLSAAMGIISKGSETIELAITKTQSYRVLRTDAAVNHGNSGGALWNMNGEVIGIINAKDDGSDVDNMGYAIPASTVRRLVKNLYDAYVADPDAEVVIGGYKALLNADVEITDCYSRYNEETGNAEVYETVVISLVRGSPAIDEGGLRKNDVIRNIKITSSEGVVREDQKINRKYYISDMLFSVRQGDTVTVTVERNGQELDVTLKYEKDSYFKRFE
jgi:serine protease Do